VPKPASEEHNKIYEMLKAVGEANYGVVTQCFSFAKFQDATSDFYENILWKINSKVGGCNSRFPIDKSVFDHETALVIGIKSSKNAAAVISIFGKNFSQILSSCRPKEELLDCLVRHCENALTKLQLKIQHVVVYSTDKNLLSKEELLHLKPELLQFGLQWSVVRVNINPEVHFFETAPRRHPNQKFPAGVCIPSPIDPDIFYLTSIERVSCLLLFTSLSLSNLKFIYIFFITHYRPTLQHW